MLVQGTSARTRSKPSTSNCPACPASLVETIVADIRRQFASIRSSFSCETSRATIEPWFCILSARCVVFVPGAAQKSSTAVPGFGSAVTTTSVAAGSCGCTSPRSKGPSEVTSHQSSSTTLSPLT